MRLFPHYIWKNIRFCQVVIPFLYLPSILFYSGENLFFIVGKYSKFLLLRSRFVLFFMDSKISKYSPLPHRFKWIFHGFLLASSWLRSRLPLEFNIVFSGFARASLVLRWDLYIGGNVNKCQQSRLFYTWPQNSKPPVFCVRFVRGFDRYAWAAFSRFALASKRIGDDIPYRRKY